MIADTAFTFSALRRVLHCAGCRGVSMPFADEALLRLQGGQHSPFRREVHVAAAEDGRTDHL